MYAGLSILFFFLVIFLQQVAGYCAVGSGLDDLAGHGRDVRPLEPVRARSPTATARGSSWPAGPSPPAGILLLLDSA